MTKENFIKLYKKDGLILVQHAEKVGLNNTPLMQYVPQSTVSTMLGHGWHIVADVPTPPEALPIENNEIKEEIKEPVKRGRKPNQK